MGEEEGMSEGDAVGEEEGWREMVGVMDTVGKEVVGVDVGDAQLDGSSSSAVLVPSSVVVAVSSPSSVAPSVVAVVVSTFTGCHSSKISFPT